MKKCECDPTTQVRREYSGKWISEGVEGALQRMSDLQGPIEALIEHLPKGGQWLDLGCGAGTAAFPAAQQARWVVGIDFTPVAVATAEAARRCLRLENLCFATMDMTRLGFRDGSFNVVVSQAAINLVPDKQAVFEEAARVLKPGGMLCISDAFVEHRRCFDDRLWARCVTGAMTPHECKEKLSSAGLEVVRIEDLTEEVRGLVEMGKWSWPEFIENDLTYLVFLCSKQ